MHSNTAELSDGASTLPTGAHSDRAFHGEHLAEVVYRFWDGGPHSVDLQQADIGPSFLQQGKNSAIVRAAKTSATSVFSKASSRPVPERSVEANNAILMYPLPSWIEGRNTAKSYSVYESWARRVTAQHWVELAGGILPKGAFRGQGRPYFHPLGDIAGPGGTRVRSQRHEHP